MAVLVLRYPDIAYHISIYLDYHFNIWFYLIKSKKMPSFGITRILILSANKELKTGLSFIKHL